MATYLDEILLAHRKKAANDRRSTAELQQAVAGLVPPRDFAGALRNAPGNFGVIAEIKRRSPSAGDLSVGLDPAQTAWHYVQGGASCISVLTDSEHFGGSPVDLKAARDATSVPVLRKDFTVAECDLYDARAMGADAVLLIAAALSDEELQRFVVLAGELGLCTLVEVHDEAEVERALGAKASVIGVNQRDLHTFEVDTARAVRVRPQIPRDLIAIAESGIANADDARVLADAGFDGVLVGSSLVQASDPVRAVRALCDLAGVADRRS